MDWHEVRACNFCGEQRFSVYVESSRPTWYEKRPLRLTECMNCHLVCASPRPDRIQVNEGYLTGQGNARAATERKLARANVRDIHRGVVEQCATFLEEKPKTLFDMGCGAGSLLREAAAMGIEAWGNDINKYSVDRLKEEGIKAVHGFTADLELPENQFDIVTNLDYLAHSYEPFDDIKACHRILRPGGVLHIKTLYLDCPDHIMNDDGWKLFGQGHYHFFWPRVLMDMVVSAGFQVIDLRLGGLVRLTARKLINR